jgi:hypothetical protein
MKIDICLSCLFRYFQEVKAVKEWIDEEQESVSNEALRKLEEKLQSVKTE